MPDGVGDRDRGSALSRHRDSGPGAALAVRGSPDDGPPPVRADRARPAAAVSLPSDDELAAALAANEAHVRDLERAHAEVVAAARDANADDEHDPEGATLAFEREQLAALLGQARRSGDDLRRARELVRSGDFGRCEVCGGPVGDERLRARPTARTCIGCARRR